MVDRAAPPLCPSPPPYYCDLMSHGQHRTPPLTYTVLGLNLSARLEQQLQAWVIAIHCRAVQGSVPFLGEEWRWGGGEGERGEGGGGRGRPVINGSVMTNGSYAQRIL